MSALTKTNYIDNIQSMTSDNRNGMNSKRKLLSNESRMSKRHKPNRNAMENRSGRTELERQLTLFEEYEKEQELKEKKETLQLLYGTQSQQLDSENDKDSLDAMSDKENNQNVNGRVNKEEEEEEEEESESDEDVDLVQSDIYTPQKHIQHKKYIDEAEDDHDMHLSPEPMKIEMNLMKMTKIKCHKDGIVFSVNGHGEMNLNDFRQNI